LLPPNDSLRYFVYAEKKITLVFESRERERERENISSDKAGH